MKMCALNSHTKLKTIGKQDGSSNTHLRIEVDIAYEDECRLVT